MKCKECKCSFKPKESFHKLCDYCAIRKFRKESGKCETCGLKIGGFSDQYFVLSCTCLEGRELNDNDYYYGQFDQD